MAAGKPRAPPATIAETEDLINAGQGAPKAEDAPQKDAADATEKETPAGDADPKQQEQQQAVATLIQGVAIAQSKGGCWSIKQAAILNNAIRQLTGNAEPSVLPAFDPSESPADNLPPSQRSVIYLIQAIGFGQAKGAFNLEQAGILDAALDVLTTENKSD